MVVRVDGFVAVSSSNKMGGGDGRKNQGWFLACLLDKQTSKGVCLTAGFFEHNKKQEEEDGDEGVCVLVCLNMKAACHGAVLESNKGCLLGFFSAVIENERVRVRDDDDDASPHSRIHAYIW